MTTCVHAVLRAAIRRKRDGGAVKKSPPAHLPGGDLDLAWPGAGKPVRMTGPAVEVFSGEWSAPGVAVAVAAGASGR